ncbi:MAG: biotin/lipoyl-binding protein, partial [Lysobacterales bacterium]
MAQTPARSLRPAAAMTAPGSCPAIRLPALLLTMAMALVVAACGGNGGDAGAGAAPPTVTAAVVEDVLWVDTIEALGTAQANESVTLTAKVTEVVRRLRFEDGDRVEAGDVLVELTGQAEVAQLEEARAALNET